MNRTQDLQFPYGDEGRQVRGERVGRWGCLASRQYSNQHAGRINGVDFGQLAEHTHEHNPNQGNENRITILYYLPPG